MNEELARNKAESDAETERPTGLPEVTEARSAGTKADKMEIQRLGKVLAEQIQETEELDNGARRILDHQKTEIADLRGGRGEE